MSARTWLVLPLVLWAFPFGLYGAESRAVAEDRDQTVAGETMSPPEWKRQLRGWLEVLRESHRKGDDSAEDLKARIRQIRDPNAVAGLEAVLLDGGDYPRIEFLEPLARIGGPRAVRTLVRVSVTDTNVPVRKAAAEWIGEMENRQEAVPEYLKYLRANRYSPAAAEALSISGLTRQVSIVEAPDPALTNALVNALVLNRTTLVPVKVWRYSPHFGSGGGIPAGVGHRYSEDLRYFRVPFAVRNPEALNTLVQYTGENYSYDQAAWKKWYQRRQDMSRHEH